MKNERKGFKAFDKGLVCRGFQFKENEVFEEKNAEVCRSGFHYCKNPLDTLDYYPLIDGDGNVTEFAEVEALDEELTDNKKKFCTKKIRIGAKVDLKGFIKASIDFLFESMKGVDANSGNCSQLASSGYDSQLASSGNYSKLALDGKNGVGANIGINGLIRGKIGCWVTLAEYEEEKEDGRYFMKCVCVKSAYIDGEILKENVWYKLSDGKFVEVE